MEVSASVVVVVVIVVTVVRKRASLQMYRVLISRVLMQKRSGGGYSRK